MIHVEMDLEQMPKSSAAAGPTFRFRIIAIRRCNRRRNIFAGAVIHPTFVSPRLRMSRHQPLVMPAGMVALGSVGAGLACQQLCDAQQNEFFHRFSSFFMRLSARSRKYTGGSVASAHSMALHGHVLARADRITPI
jgi:hypothetical protein